MNPFVSFLDALRPEIEATLDQLLPASSEPPQRLHEAMRYSLFVGGKRVRPALVVLSGELFGARREELLPGAAAVEMIHTFSLVHDDLPALDDDDLRRGQATVHKRYDEALAVLVGDALANLGLEVLARHPEAASPEVRLEAVQLATAAVGTFGMIGGQVDDIEAEKSTPDAAAEMLESIHRRKTGALLVASLRLGGLYGGASADEHRRLMELGHGVGLMFQIADDILDVEGTSAELGKTAGKDIRAEKLTYPRVYGLETSKTMVRQLREQTLEVARLLPGEGTILVGLVDYLSTRDR